MVVSQVIKKCFIGVCIYAFPYFYRLPQERALILRFHGHTS